MIKLSILICHVPVPQREELFRELLAVIQPQMPGHPVELRVNADTGITTGAKRNDLLQRSQGGYVIFVDDDDIVPGYYVSEMLAGIESGADCMAINGIMTTDGRNETAWRISKDYENKTIQENGKPVMLRKTNHITAVRREIALKAGFPNKSNAEDKYYSDRVAPLCKTEFKIEKPMYWYRYSTKNKLYA